MDDNQVMHGMSIDDVYHVERILAERRGSRTELVTLGGAGPFVRKKIPLNCVNRAVWATLPSCSCLRLPQMVATYELPDVFAVIYAYVPGETLSARVRQRRRLPAVEAVSIACDLCEAAAALHAHGVVHCDITPSNIVIAADGAHLIDLELARMLADPAPNRSEGLGTRGFASPEQCFDRPDVRADVYAIGRVLGFMLTGIRPDEEGYAELLADDAVVTPELRALVEQASAYERSERFATVVAFGRALEESKTADLRGLFVATANRKGSEREEPRYPLSQQPPFNGQTAQARASQRIEAEASASSADEMQAFASPMSTISHKRRVIKFALLALAAICVLAAIGITVHEAVVPVEPGTQQESASSSKDADQQLFGGGDGTQGQQDGGNDSAAVDGGASEADDAAESLEIVESWWEQPSTGLFNYVTGVRNTSDDTIYEFPTIYITAYDANGVRINRTDQVLLELAPGQTIYFSSIAGLDGNEPASVEFEVGGSPYGSSTRRGAANPSTFEVSNVSVVDDGLGGVAVTGDFTTTHVGIDAEMGTGTAITVVFRDAEGAIVGGETTFADFPDEGESSTFSASIPSPPSAYDRVEVYVIPW